MHDVTQPMTTLYAFWLLIQQSSVGWTGDVARTVMLTLITAFTGGAFTLLWGMRDDVRDSKKLLGDEEKRTGLIGKLGSLDRRVKHIELRNVRVDAVFRQYVVDMSHMPDGGGGQRASDRVFQQAMAGALGVQRESPPSDPPDTL